jgi:hypothetical protein
MSIDEISAAPELVVAEVVPVSRSRAAFDRFEALLERASERLNPILVKEARQALKSKQFMTTFTLLLAFGWLWSILGLAILGPGVDQLSSGPQMFTGFYAILAFPLIVIVPYGAFRSLAAEREDRTFELLSIATLSAQQIVAGKLAAAVLQMTIYLSALLPCLAFTYLLQGIDIFSIVVLVGYVLLGSLAFSLIGILLATINIEKYLQMALSVAFVFALGGSFLFAATVAGELMYFGRLALDQRDFWLSNAAMLTAYVTYFVLLFLAAAAQLNFASSNRSTALRVTMLVQQACLVGWMGAIWMWQEQGAGYVIIAAMTMAGIHWFVMGMFMTGESPVLSPRVKRDLPQSFLGRALLTWFNPGPGTGYMFAVSNVVAVALLALASVIFRPTTGGTVWAANLPERVIYFALLGTCYMVIYLGIGKLLLDLIQRVTPATIVHRFVVHVLLMLAGCGIPMVIELSLFDARFPGYSLLEITNPVWTLATVAGGTIINSDMSVLIVVLSIAATGVLLANLPSVVAEVRNVRIARPIRVVDEDAELAAVTAAPTESVRTSPWD